MIQIRFNLIPLLTLFIFTYGVDVASAQNSGQNFESAGIDAVQSESREKTPEKAFVRSLILPGWGHFYAGDAHQTRGYFHTGSDLVFIASIFGFSVRANRLEADYLTFANLNSGIDLSSRDRAFRLAVGDFDSLDEYNDYQLRTRNWNRLIDDTPENRWQWTSSDDRSRYRSMRSDAENIRSQLPAIAGLMVVNRVISGISAYNRVRKGLYENRVQVSLQPVNRSNSAGKSPGLHGVTAHINIHFN